MHFERFDLLGLTTRGMCSRRQYKLLLLSLTLRFDRTTGASWENGYFHLLEVDGECNFSFLVLFFEPRT